ncbi:hypothetical protein [Mycolicibacterium sp. lyk4-40-TYG-92]|uniref:hypothetical protein n=1 Tax=Mycolicibacterium sp. lyk4-40-TYG-92 TaxID=3040295 RepID=UPI00254B7442|nr:hypothetical protein [Mycolicibacterium sp. lyk4-40-TYG-92]
MKAAHFGDESRSSRLQTAMAHSLIYVLAAAALVRALSWFGMLTVVNAFVAAVLLTCWLVSGIHRRKDHLCFRCMNEVPADAPTRAERRKRSLRFAHFTSSLRGLPVTIMIVGGPVALGLAVYGTTPTVYLIPGDLWMFAVIYTEWLHHRLRPWCPYCRPWDEGGDAEPAPDPTLFGTKTRS